MRLIRIDDGGIGMDNSSSLSREPYSSDCVAVTEPNRHRSNTKAPVAAK